MIGLTRTAAILSAMILGALLPQAHHLAGAIRWLVMGMLFLVFVQSRLTRAALRPTHFVLLATNIALGFVAWGAGWLIGGREVALAAFFCGITPTAIAAPVIISFLRGRVEFVVAAFLLTNITIAALLPLILPIVLGRATPEAFIAVSRNIAVVVFIPMALAWVVRALHQPAAEWAGRQRTLSFAMWVGTMFLITSNASYFLRQQAEAPLVMVLKVAGISMLVCVASFGIGRLIGGREFPREASQALGQKNTAFTIYLAMTYASPLVALGPSCYVIWHNLWNSWQLHRDARRSTADTL